MKHLIIAISIAIIVIIAYFMLSQRAVAPVVETTDTSTIETTAVDATASTAVENTENNEDTAENIVIEKSSLSDGQQKALETFGVESDTIVITPEMIACAEEKIGKARVDAIISGDSPTFMEGVSLVSCY